VKKVAAAAAGERNRAIWRHQSEMARNGENQSVSSGNEKYGNENNHHEAKVEISAAGEGGENEGNNISETA
jgi:hypothetical protein